MTEIYKTTFASRVRTAKLYRQTDPDTSKEAAESLEGETLPHLEATVYWIICQYPEGCIQDQVISDAADLDGHFAYSSITARFRGLLDKGRIDRLDEKRPGQSGRQQSVLLADIYRKGQVNGT